MMNVMTPQIVSRPTWIARSLIGLMFLSGIPSATAAIALDRTRVVFDGEQKSISLNISNQNPSLPYLAQAWIENEKGEKIDSPFTVLPPVQRVEPRESSQVKIQALPAVAALPQDRESIYYFNLREIPPKSEQPNTLQLALQTRIKMFYRPKALMAQVAKATTPYQEHLTLRQSGGQYQVTNPTGYYITIVDVDARQGGPGVKDFNGIMVAPNSTMALGASVAQLGSKPVLTYINDFGGRPTLTFNCTSTACQLVPEKG